MENGKQGAFPKRADGAPQTGLTKREYFAGLAMQGLLHTYNGQLPVNEIADAFAMESVIMADALLAELKKTEKA